MKPMLHALAVSFAAASLAAAAAAQYVLPAAPAPHPVFQGTVTTTLGSALDAKPADVNGDGRADLLVATSASVTWRPGLGGGLFGAPTAIPDSGGLMVLEPCDLDGDGHVDLVGARTNGEDGDLHVALGDGAGGFAAPVTYGFESEAFYSHSLLLIAADADGDLDIDLTLSAFSDFVPGTGHFAVYVNDGTGALAPEVVDPLVPGTFARAADFNNDGLADVLVSGFTGIGDPSTHRVLLGQPGGGFTEVGQLDGQYLYADVADLEADGNQDVVVSKLTGLAIWMGAGDGTFSLLEDEELGFLVHSLEHGDVDGDGLVDLVVYRQADAWILAGQGDGTLRPVAAVSMGDFGGLFGPHPKLAELDGDGKLDVVAALEVDTPDAVVVAARNVSYPAGGPLADWGGSIRGGHGFPRQVVSSTLVPGTPFSVAIHQGRPSGLAFFVLGFDAAFVPLKGGTLVPQFDRLIGPVPLNASGSLSVSTPWPAGIPSGQTFDLQAWIPDWGTAFGASSTTDTHLVQP